MSSPIPTCITCSDLRLQWPDGSTALDGLDLTLGTGRTGLVGRNGTGKSTLLRVIGGALRPTSGSVSVDGLIAYLPQRLPLDVGRTVADLLGITGERAALAAIEAGSTDPAHHARIEGRWDIEARAVATLHRFGLDLGDDPLDRLVGSLSGGEGVLAGVAGVRLRSAAVTLLDEPTNNLDEAGRALLYSAIDGWPGVLVVASHDRALLERMDRIVELRDGSARTVDGPFSMYEQVIEAEQDTARRLVRAAEGDLARERRQLVESATKLARRRRYARTAERQKRLPKVVMHERRSQAQVSAGKHRILHEDRLATASSALADAERAVREDDVIRIDLPATVVPAGRDVARVGDHTVRGPERISLTGPIGAGKTTLLRALAGAGGRLVSVHVPVGHLPQRLDGYDDGRSVLEHVRAAAPGLTPHLARAALARFLFRGAAVDRAAVTLSGGERLRLALCCVLHTAPAPQLLLLDEPTNDLDLDSVGHLVQALSCFGGALLVASHDRSFLAELDVDRGWHLVDGALRDRTS